MDQKYFIPRAAHPWDKPISDSKVAKSSNFELRLLRTTISHCDTFSMQNNLTLHLPIFKCAQIKVSKLGPCCLHLLDFLFLHTCNFNLKTHFVKFCKNPPLQHRRKCCNSRKKSYIYLIIGNHNLC